MNEGCPHRGACIAGFLYFYMGTLRWNGRDARFCIENRFTVFARFCRLQIGRARHGDNLARSVFGKLKHAQDKSCGLAAVIQSRIRRCRVFVYRDLIVYLRAAEEYQGFSGIVSRETKTRQSERSGSALTVFVFFGSVCTWI